MLQQHLILHNFYLMVYFPSLGIYVFILFTFLTLSPHETMLQNIYLYFYMLLNSSMKTDSQFLIFKLSLLSSAVLFLEMAFLLNSDHLGGGCLNDV